ncbi:MAG: hypothetical protein IJU50_05665, partial [Lachnospiraceae bacterium]|nr:hypothetical protein [Lachnospiraceae bacterium]
METPLISVSLKTLQKLVVIVEILMSTFCQNVFGTIQIVILYILLICGPGAENWGDLAIKPTFSQKTL